jgi:DNA polymerase III alpha subunit
MMEKEVLGFYLSSHPLAEFEEKLSQFCTHTTATPPSTRISTWKTRTARSAASSGPTSFVSTANWSKADAVLAVRGVDRPPRRVTKPT